jgi:hypothetical protein
MKDSLSYRGRAGSLEGPRSEEAHVSLMRANVHKSLETYSISEYKREDSIEYMLCDGDIKDTRYSKDPITWYDITLHISNMFYARVYSINNILGGAA